MPGRSNIKVIKALQNSKETKAKENGDKEKSGTWLIHPVVRATAKRTVNIETGMPMALSTMPGQDKGHKEH